MTAMSNFSRSGIRSLRGKPKDVPHTPHRVDQPRFQDVDLLPQIADVGLHDRGVAAEIVVPDVVEDLALRKDPARVGEKESQEVELGRGQLDRLSRSPYLVRVLVHLEVGEAESPL